MWQWWSATGLLCLYGFWKEFRPSEPFLNPYLIEYKNFTDDQISSEIYPFWTYSYLCFLIPVFVLTDLLRHKPVLVCESLAYIGTWSLIIWGTSIVSQQLMQVAYGVATATEVGYYAYVYTVIDKRYYQKATGYLRGSVLLGRSLAYGLGQLLLSLGVINYLTINYISLSAVSLVFVISLFLPFPTDPTTPLSCQFVADYFRSLKTTFISSYSDGFILKWSLWWALGMCGFLQVGNYIQILWSEIHPSTEDLYNGLTEVINGLVGAIAVICLQFLNVDWKHYGELIIGLIALVEGALLATISQTGEIIIAYAFYVAFCVLYQILITIATFNIAHKLELASQGLVIGFNGFIALLLQTILTLAVADQNGFDLTIRPQFVVYGGYYGCIGVSFLTAAVITLWQYRRLTKETPSEEPLSVQNE